MIGSVIFRIWCPDLAYTNISQGIKKDVVICHTLALDYDIDQLGN
jgi:hypothetical protein